jgi:8-oxo-dGTP pyrophosphatase MutT (NUDIX family)
MLDVLHETGTRTGRTVVRGTELPPGEYHLVVHVWIRNEAGEYLIQQRALHLVSGPGMWATTVGYVLAGEESIAGAIRETIEELGIPLSPAQFKRHERLKWEKLIEDIWFVEVSRDGVGTPLLGPEVAAWKWASKHELREMISRGTFFRYSYFDALPE